MESWDKTTWNAEDIIEQAENWSLAGDATLLKSIKAFAFNVLAKTEKFSENIDSLLNNLDEASLTLDIAQNEFQSLRNTQFIENRVYEDDETLDSNVEEKVVEKAPSEEQEMSIVDSVIMGMNILDKYYDAVEVSLSDSEEESEKSFILRPKDVYLQRPLPPVIGTDEWYKKWSLEDSSSGSESDKVSEIYSESDSEDNLPKDLLKGSETSSELEFLSQTSETRPVANSTFNDSAKKIDSIIESDDSGREDSLSIKSPLSNRTFAEQLTAKLDRVISKEDNQRIDDDIATVKDEEINKKPIKPAGVNKYGDLFADEPPPLFDAPVVKTGLFSGGQGLFDENDDPLFWDNPAKVSTKQNETNDVKTVDKMVVPEKISFLPKASQVSKGLFDSDDSSDEEFFGYDKRRHGKTPFLQPNNRPVVPLFDDEPPELLSPKKSPPESSNKKPIDDIFTPGSSDLFNEGLKNVLKKQQPDNIENESDSTKRTNINTEFENPQETSSQKILVKKPSLFGDAEAKNESNKPNFKNEVSLFDSNMNSTSSKQKISLFDDDDELFEDELFSSVAPTKPSYNLFDDLDNSFDSFTSKTEDHSGTKKDINSNKSITHQKTSEEVEQYNTNTRNEIDNLGVMNNNNKSSKEAEYAKADSKNVVNAISSDNKNNDSFGNKDGITVISPPEEMEKYPFPKSPSEDSEATVKTEPKSEMNASTIRLFDSTPPPDDDADWDAKSDFSYTEDFAPYRAEGNLDRSSLFDDEPPSLDANESSGIVRDQNSTRVDTDDSSFYPYASSSRRLSSDIFNEQQSQDSFFVTKSRMDSATVSSSLDIIPENSGVSSGSFEYLLDDTNAHADREQNINDKKLSFTGKTEVDGEVNANKRNSALDVTENTIGSPGKLKHNLNINVSALMPGYVPPKTREVARSPSPGLPSETENRGILKSNDNFRSTASTEDSTNGNICKSVSFEDMENIEVLASITKDRARIPIKRRPSTRRGRQEAIRKSVIDNVSSHVDDSHDTKEEETVEESNNSANFNLKKSHDTKQKEETVKDSTSTTTPSIENNNANEENEDSEPFEASLSSTLEPATDSKTMFGSESGSDDDLFASKKPKRNRKQPDAPKKSLFEDSSSDEDLFKSDSRRGKTDPPLENKIKKTIVSKKLGGLEASEDPLSDLLK